MTEPTHPRDYPINAAARARCDAFHETSGGPYSPAAELEWLWEELAQVTAALKLRADRAEKLTALCAALQEQLTTHPHQFTLAAQMGMPMAEAWDRLMTTAGVVKPLPPCTCDHDVPPAACHCERCQCAANCEEDKP